MKSFKNILIQLTQNGMGLGDKTLGLQLAKNYLTLLNEETELPKVIVFYNEGVKLLCSNSPVLEPLQKLTKNGVKLVACKTCLIHFKLIDDLQLGVVGTMMDIMQLQKVADKVISL